MRLKELMTEEEITEWEQQQIEDRRKRRKEIAEELHEKNLIRKRRSKIEEKTPVHYLDRQLQDFRKNLFSIVEKNDVLINSQHVSGLNEREKNELKRMIVKIPDKNINTIFKRQTFTKKIVKLKMVATLIREEWEFGSPEGYRDLEALNAKFPSLIKVNFKDYREWEKQYHIGKEKMEAEKCIEKR